MSFSEMLAKPIVTSLKGAYGDDLQKKTKEQKKEMKGE
jgi:hypothetical protein